MQNLAYLAFAFAMGGIMATYLPVLSQSGRIVDSPILANVPFFLLGTLTSLVLALGMGNRGDDFARLKDVPPWMFLAGVVSGLMVLGSTILIPRIGPAAFFVLLVAGQIFTGALLSHFGLLGAAVSPINGLKVFGIVMVIAGAGIATFN